MPKRTPEATQLQTQHGVELASLCSGHGAIERGAVSVLVSVGFAFPSAPVRRGTACNVAKIPWIQENSAAVLFCTLQLKNLITDFQTPAYAISPPELARKG
jgi:hypothetical protein